MAATVTTDVVSVREDLADVIAMITPEDSPLFTTAKKETQNSTKHEWLVEELNAPADNKHAENVTFSDGTIQQPVRLDNIAQIMNKVRGVSRTVESVTKAGRASEVARAKVLAGKELKKDVERALLVDNAKVASGTREMAGLSSYITNGDFATNMAAATGDGSDVPDAVGTASALTMARVEVALQAAYEDGGNPTIAMMSPAVKRKFSAATDGFVSGTQAQVQHTKAEPIQFVSAVSVFLSDFGTVNCVPNRVMNSATSLEDRIYLIDPDYVCVTNLPNANFITDDLAKTSDGERFAMVWEGSLKVPAPKAHAMVLGIS